MTKKMETTSNRESSCDHFSYFYILQQANYSLVNAEKTLVNWVISAMGYFVRKYGDVTYVPFLV